jgi:hypothetical protein
MEKILKMKKMGKIFKNEQIEKRKPILVNNITNTT